MEEEERDGYALLCQAHAASAELAIEVREIRPPRPEMQVKSLPCRIERMQLLAPDVMAVFLRLPAHEDVSLRRRPVPGHHAAAEPAPQFFDRELRRDATS